MKCPLLVSTGHDITDDLDALTLPHTSQDLVHKTEGPQEPTGPQQLLRKLRAPKQRSLPTWHSPEGWAWQGNKGAWESVLSCHGAESLHGKGGQ